MDLEDLETFVEVADAGGVSAAARRLNLSKSIISRRLARLEAAFGAQLLARTTRGMALTEAGTAFRGIAAKVSADLHLARDTLLPAGDERGRLRIAVPLTFGPTHVAPVLAELARRHPRLQIHASYTDRFIDLVAEGYDCAIRVGYLSDSALIARRIGPIRGRLVASPGYIRAYGAPNTPDDLMDHEALMQGAETWQFQGGDGPIMIHPQGRFKANNGPALLAAALAGLGIAGLPDFLIDAHVASGALVPVMTGYPVAEAGIYVLRPPGPHPARKVGVLIELLIEQFK